MSSTETAQGDEPSRSAYTPKHLADRLLNTRAALHGEHKQVTVLFADVQHSTELASRLDVEDWHGILDGLFQLLAREVHALDGTVNQFTGDGIMALFGAPVAHEDHARRACLAALAILDAARAFGEGVRSRYDVEFRLRVGINSGGVVVGSIGDALRTDYTAQGPVVHLAARAQSMADAGAAWVAPDTVEQVRAFFRFVDVGEHRVKGIDAPVRFHRLSGRSAATTHFDISRSRGLASFQGRNHEMQVLDDALDQASRGNGQVVGISAEPGVGKSRICFEFMSRCRDRGLRYLYGVCPSHGKSLPLDPILQVLRDYYGISTGEAPDSARSKVSDRMLAIDDSFAESLPLIYEFLGISDPGNPPAPMPPEAKQRRLYLVLREALRRGPEPDQPLGIVVIEDLHWIDSGSDEWVSQWVDFTASAASLLVVNFRPEYQPQWMHRSHCQKISLTPLSLEELRGLISSRIGDNAALNDLVERIFEISGGNPFYAEEIVRSLIDAGTLTEDDGAFELTKPLHHIEIPKSVQAVLSARIDRLSDQEKDVLQAASVIGKRFDEELLRNITQSRANALPRWLESLCANEYLQQEAYYPRTVYSFRHPLTQQVAYESLLREKRREMHAAVAHAIRDRSTDASEDAALLAHHFTHAGDAVSAAQWHMAAADRIGVNDVSAALDHAAAVLDVLDLADPPREVAPLLAGAAAKVLALSVRTGIRHDIDVVYAQGKHRAQQSQDPIMEAVLAGAYAGSLAVDGRVEESFEAGAEFFDIADRVGAVELAQVATAWSAFPCLRTGRFAEAEQRVDQAIALARENPDLGKSFYGQGMVGLFLDWRAEIYARTREWHEVERAILETLEWVREHGEIEYHIYILWLQAECLRLFGTDEDAALSQLRDGLAMAEEWGAAWPLTIARMGLADGLVQTGREPAEALDLVSLALKDVRERRIARHFEGSILAIMAQAELALGRGESALPRAHEAVEKASAVPLSLVNALIGLTRVTLALGDLVGCGSALAKLSEIVRSFDAANYFPLLAWLEGDYAAARGDTDKAAERLRTARQGFLARGAAVHARAVERALG